MDQGPLSPLPGSFGDRQTRRAFSPPQTGLSPWGRSACGCSSRPLGEWEAWVCRELGGEGPGCPLSWASSGSGACLAGTTSGGPFALLSTACVTRLGPFQRQAQPPVCEQRRLVGDGLPGPLPPFLTI